MPLFRLVHLSGEDLGVHRFAVPGWEEGDMITLGGSSLRVVDVGWDDDEEAEAVLTVEVAES